MQILVENQLGNYVPLDLFKDFEIKYNHDIYDYKEFGGRKMPYTEKFKVPMTLSNRERLGVDFDLTYPTSYELNGKVLFSDDSLAFNCKVYVLGSSINTLEPYIELQIIDKITESMNKLKSVKLSEMYKDDDINIKDVYDFVDGREYQIASANYGDGAGLAFASPFGEETQFNPVFSPDKFIKKCLTHVGLTEGSDFEVKFGDKDILGVKMTDIGMMLPVVPSNWISFAAYNTALIAHERPITVASDENDLDAISNIIGGSRLAIGYDTIGADPYVKNVPILNNVVDGIFDEIENHGALYNGNYEIVQEITSDFIYRVLDIDARWYAFEYFGNRIEYAIRDLSKFSISWTAGNIYMTFGSNEDGKYAETGEINDYYDDYNKVKIGTLVEVVSENGKLKLKYAVDKTQKHYFETSVGENFHPLLVSDEVISLHSTDPLAIEAKDFIGVQVLSAEADIKIGENNLSTNYKRSVVGTLVGSILFEGNTSPIFPTNIGRTYIKEFVPQFDIKHSLQNKASKIKVYNHSEDVDLSSFNLGASFFNSKGDLTLLQAILLIVQRFNLYMTQIDGKVMIETEGFIRGYEAYANSTASSTDTSISEVVIDAIIDNDIVTQYENNEIGTLSVADSNSSIYDDDKNKLNEYVIRPDRKESINLQFDSCIYNGRLFDFSESGINSNVADLLKTYNNMKFWGASKFKKIKASELKPTFGLLKKVSKTVDVYYPRLGYSSTYSSLLTPDDDLASFLNLRYFIAFFKTTSTLSDKAEFIESDFLESFRFNSPKLPDTLFDLTYGADVKELLDDRSVVIRISAYVDENTFRLLTKFKDVRLRNKLWTYRGFSDYDLSSMNGSICQIELTKKIT